ncbi:MAG: transposase [Sedimentisphaerales bacterium]|nr:transposase [Sedimentisphaerales bacterium]
MARLLRVEYEGALYHVTARGNERRAIFLDDKDRVRFVSKLAETAETYHLRLYAYVLMSNHYHLVVCTPRGNLSAAMQQFQSSYTTWFNCRHGRSGHLYGGRYKARLVEGDEYLLSLTRYVHLNPVRVGSVSKKPLAEKVKLLRGYEWSSYGGYAGLRAKEGWVDYGPLRELVGRGRSRKAKAYREYVEAGLAEDDEELAEAMSLSSKAIGGKVFCAWVKQRYRDLAGAQGSEVDVALRREEVPPDPAEVVGWVCERFEVKKEELLKARGNSAARDVAMKALHELSGLTKREVGRMLGHADGATVGKRLKVLSDEMGRRKGLRKSWNELQNSIHIANCKA